MIFKLAKTAPCLITLTLVAACGGLPDGDELRYDIDSQGRFSGLAGANWTPDEIDREASALCANGDVTGYSVRIFPSEPDYKLFSGTCVSGAALPIGAGVSLETQQSYSQPAAAASVSQPIVQTPAGGWDGSTPFVD